MTAQTKDVDVLETLRRIAEGEGDTEVLAMRAHAAIAKLIEKANTALAFVGYDGRGAERVKEELREALASVGGAQ